MSEEKWEGGRPTAWGRERGTRDSHQLLERRAALYLAGRGAGARLAGAA